MSNRNPDGIAAVLRRFELLLLALMLPMLVACSAEKTLSAEEVLNNMLAGIGSERERAAVQSLETSAEGSGPDGPFAVSITSIPPGTVYLRQQSFQGITEIWSTPERTWGGDAGEKYEPLGLQVRDYVRDHEFHLMLLDIKSRFSDFELRGKDIVAGHECYRIFMYREAGGRSSICVRQEDWLPVELQLGRGSTAESLQIRFDDWRAVNGLILFHAVTVGEGREEVKAYNYVDISINTFAYEVDIEPPSPPRNPGDAS